MSFATDLPIEPALPELCRALAVGHSAVLRAPPGAGKTTRVPLALIDEPWVAGRRILMLEPRRLATRAAAARMAELLGEPVGQTVGYRMRLDTRVGPRTRIEVITEGILTRLIQADPTLDGIAAVIFDEFHERSLDADLGLALCLDVQRALRGDLRILVMSATLDGAAISALLDDAPVIAAEGRAFPVETRWIGVAAAESVEASTAALARRALDETEGDLLVFLPGGREIRRAEHRLRAIGLSSEVAVLPLYGDLPQQAQDQALRPAPAGRRKVVLSTSIAETSLTIEGVRVVVDSGLMRVPRFEPRTGMTRLVTVKVSQAAAEQRRGRAGRTAPGVCYRLWAEAAHLALPHFTAPEIQQADLAQLALALAEWGITDPAALAWLDPPPAPALTQARALLAELGALDHDLKITVHGREIAGFGTHPRLAHMMIAGAAEGLGALACDIAALLTGGDLRLIPGQEVDLRLRLNALRGEPINDPAHRRGLRRAHDQARAWRRQLGVAGRSSEPSAAGRVLALAYPDRIAQRRAGTRGRFRLSGGSGAVLPPQDPLAGIDFLAVAELDGDSRDARIFLAAPITLQEIEDAFAERATREEAVWWDARDEAVLARRLTKLGALVLHDERIASPAPDRITAALLDGIRSLGLDALPWTKEARHLQQRIAFLRRIEPGCADWPDLSDAALLDTLEEWLAPFVGGIMRRAQLDRVDLEAALRAQLSWEQQRRLDELAPTHLVAPSGSRLPVDYAGSLPVLAVRLQEMFGAAATPRVAGGRVPVVLHLLSPAGRPLQVTQDLAGFWGSSYRAVRSEMRGRYPKHPWPEDPLTARPTSRAKPRG